jgi:hypothetical protein
MSMFRIRYSSCALALLIFTFTATLVALPFSTVVFGQDLSGTWSGMFRSTGPAGSLEMNFSRSANTLNGETTIRFEGQEAKGAMRDLAVVEDKISFSSTLDGAEAKFTGAVKGPKILGTFEVFERGLLTAGGAFCVSKDTAAKCAETDVPPLRAVQLKVQRADENYDTTVANPAYTSTHPKVLFDEAHRNLHKTTGNFKPFVDLIRHDGYAITPNTDPFSASVLNGYDILVIANARGEANGSAFTDDEIEAVIEWVRRGGSLLLIADHTPFGGFAEKLANRFGVDMSKGYTDDPANRDPVIKDLLFSRDNTLLGDHPVTNGRNAGEHINRVVSFTGQSLKSPDAVPILKLADTAYDEFPNSDKELPAAGRAQALAFEYGKGKVFVSGEAGMLTAQLTRDDRKFGLNVPGIDNRQYALNIVHWLSGLLK